MNQTGNHTTGQKINTEGQKINTGRNLSTKKYLVAFVLTIIIFTGGIFLGMLFEKVQLNSSEKTILNEKVSLQSLQLQQKYIESGTNCTGLNKVLQTNINDLTRKMQEVAEYQKKAIFSQDKFDLQLRDYFLTEIQFFLISQEINKKCPKDNVNILYFYDENAFDTQGDILDYVKKVFGDSVLIFSFDSAFKKEPMIDVLMASYGITKFPSVVIEENVFQDHTSVETIFKVVCDEFESQGRKVPVKCATVNLN
ncbi:hypothetical protein HYX13_00110 [Candidatus Woesearchaeota archaeon]|nr:hypothetical protein [Candidatus Woesearchaeota archaeon]